MRNPTFDIVKGIGIMAVIVGHSAAPMLAKDFIFTWHMPLFFLVSGYFFRVKPFGESLRSNVRGLLAPYLITATVLFLLAACLSVAKGSPDEAFNPFVGIFVGAGSHGLPNFGDYNVGAIWFLLAMFWCRVLYNTLATKLSLKYLGVVTLLLFAATVYLGQVVYVPTDLLQGVGAMLFFFVGHWAGSVKLAERPVMWPVVVAAVAGLVASMWVCPAEDYPMSMVRSYYCCWPLNVVAAVLCAYCLYHVARLLSSWAWLSNFLSYFGRTSLLVLCVHIVGINYGGKVVWFVLHRLLALAHWQESLVIILFDLTFALLGAYVLAQSRMVRRVFGLREG